MKYAQTYFIRKRIRLCFYVLMCILLYAQVSFSQENANKVMSVESYSFNNQLPDSNEILSNIHKGIANWPSQVDTAIAILLKALKESEQLNYSEGIGSSVFSLAVIYANTGRYEEALTVFQETFRHCAQNVYLRPTLPIIANVIANMYQSHGNYAQAAFYYYQAMLIFEKYHLLTTGGIYNNMGELLLIIKQDKQALYFLNKAERAAIESITINNTNGYQVLGYVSVNKSIFYANKKNWDTSESYIRTALYLAHKYQFIQLQYISLINLGNIYLLINRPQKAIQCILNAQKVQADVELYYQNIAMRVLGESYYKLNDYNKAEYYLLKALDRAEVAHLANGIIETHRLLSKIYQQKKQNGKALEHYQAYIQIKDSLAGLEATKNIGVLEVKYMTAQKDKELIQKQLLITQQQKWIAAITLSVLVLIILLIVIYKNYQNKQKLQLNQLHILQQEQEISKHQQEINNLKAMMEGEEKERARLARDLHDGIGGMLASIKMNFSAAKEDYPELATIKKLNDVELMLQDTAIEVRKTAHNLVPDILIRYNLQQALQFYCENINANSSSGLQINLQCLGALHLLNKSTELLLYRITQELIQNIIKHSQATYADIQIAVHETMLSINVEDNGIGFNTNEHKGGFGLQNLNYRVQALQGYISIASVPGESTTVYIEFDLKKLDKI